ncbi:hypothetical protein DVH24_033725 [Malus domestica]|uniref:Uncharacterized protein n=1 Tax=Malus domestica TaxID=3750 RepID=A0A498HRU8_MALDO|nr:hypothetical protein DVH24_033725 [Malus domestica]
MTIKVKQMWSNIDPKHDLLVYHFCNFDNLAKNFSEIFIVLSLFWWAIGAEYGEGFESFGHVGPLKVDVDFLEDKLQQDFLKRIRYVIKLDEAYGLIFSFDNVVVLMARNENVMNCGTLFELKETKKLMMHIRSDIERLHCNFSYTTFAIPIDRRTLHL